MEILRRWREPVAITLLVATGVRLLAGIVAVAVLASDDGYGSFAAAALFEGSRAADTLLLLATVAVAMWCLLSPPTPSGRTIAALALIETVAAILVSLVFGLMGLASDAVGRGIQFVQLLAALALPAVAAALLLALLRSAPSTVLVPPAARASTCRASRCRTSSGARHSARSAARLAARAGHGHGVADRRGGSSRGSAHRLDIAR